MKKILLVLTLTLGTLVSNAQLKSVVPIKTLGTAKRGGYTIATIKQFDSTNYSLTYWDATFSTIDVYNDIKFNGNNELIDKLYEMFKLQIEQEKGSEANFVLGEQVLKIKTTKFLGSKMIDVWVAEPLHAGNFKLTENEINKLFNK